MWRQNVLSANTTERLLARLRPRFIFTGHDHEGCRYTHALPPLPASASATESNEVHYTAQEITVRSVMAEFSGNAQLFEVHDSGTEMRYAVGRCPFFTHVEIKVLGGILAVSVLAATAWSATALRATINARLSSRRKRKLQ